MRRISGEIGRPWAIGPGNNTLMRNWVLASSVPTNSSTQLLDQVKVERALEQAATSTQPRLSSDGDEYLNVGMTEREARRMKPQLPDAVGWLLDQMATTTESVKKGGGLWPI